MPIYLALKRGGHVLAQVQSGSGLVQRYLLDEKMHEFCDKFEFRNILNNKYGSKQLATIDSVRTASAYFSQSGN
jgi:hypothetical protein